MSDNQDTAKVYEAFAELKSGRYITFHMTKEQVDQLALYLFEGKGLLREFTTFDYEDGFFALDWREVISVKVKAIVEDKVNVRDSY